ncbi:MAG: substrate-binding domain-containing protein [Tepidisphaeraceae bacterium]
MSPAPYGELVDRAMSGSSPAFDGCFVAGDDRDAVGVYSELKRRGVQIGTNFQFISTAYDPSRINVLDPSLDHIDIRPEEIGRLAVELMLWRFQNPSAERQRRLVEPVLVRSSNARN